MTDTDSRTGADTGTTTEAGPGTDTAALAARLHRLAAASHGLVVLDPGLDDAAMDGWPVPVPEGIRVLLRSVGGVRVTVSRSVTDGRESHEHVDLDHPYNHGRYHGYDVTWYQEHAGGAGSHWFLYTDHGDGHFYVDVDRDTGAWGPVFQFWDATDTERLAPSLPAWLQEFADRLEEALAHPDAAGGDDVRAFGRRFTDCWPTGEERAAEVGQVTVAEALADGDELLRAAAAGLPEDAVLADLRPVTGRASVVFDLPAATCRYARRAGGAVLVAVPWDGE